MEIIRRGAVSLRAFFTSWLRQPALVALDAAIAVASLWLALWLRFDNRIPLEYLPGLPLLTGVLVAGRVIASLGFRLHRWSFRLAGLVEGARIAVAGLVGTGLFVSFIFLLKLENVPRSVVIVECMVSTMLMAAARFSPRLTYTYFAGQLLAHAHDSSPTLIIGAGSAGELLLRDLQRCREHSFAVVGFLDDDPGRLGMSVGGRRVLGPINALPQVARKFCIENVLIAIPRIEHERIREILAMCQDLKLTFKILPVSFVYLNDRGGVSMLQDLTPEDLLPRPQVTFVEAGQSRVLEGRAVAVTGAAGSIGSEICRQLLGGGVGRLLMIDMNENGIYLLQRELQRLYPEVEVIAEVADIRDEGRLHRLLHVYSPKDVFHAAAHKHVPLMELAPAEAVKNNVQGTKFVASAAVACGAERFVYISTDKAVRPSSVMGVSKRLGEQVVRWMARRTNTRFCVVRFGNVLGSAGSVVPLFRQQIAAGGPVTVTHPEVRRYFMTIPEAVGLVLKAGYGDYGELCVLDMGKQIKIVQLAKHMITMAGKVPNVDIPIVFTGLRPGEKLLEELLTEAEEKTRSVTSKILVATPRAVPDDLDVRIRPLIAAANAEDQRRVLELLRELVPSFVTPSVASWQPAVVTSDVAEEESPLPVGLEGSAI